MGLSANGTFKCKVEGCDYRSNNQPSLYRHNAVTHLKLSRYVCNLCKFKAFDKISVENHQNSCHKDDENRKILKIGCTFCEQNVLHETHSNSKKDQFSKLLKFSCNLCDYKSYHKPHVKSHQNNNH